MGCAAHPRRVLLQRAKSIWRFWPLSGAPLKFSKTLMTLCLEKNRSRVIRLDAANSLQ
jgi:hypothetical protein